jgi:hypothetical protein
LPLMLSMRPNFTGVKFGSEVAQSLGHPPLRVHPQARLDLVVSVRVAE